MKTNIYLDYNATAPIRPAVIDMVSATMSQVGNPSSVHHAGRKAKAVTEEARTKVAALVGSRVRDVMFCSGGTEANNAVIRGSGAQSVIISATEHDSILAAVKHVAVPVYKLAVDASGLVDIDQLKSLLKEAPAPALVSVMMANNETGTIQDIKQVVEIAKEYGAVVHTDAIQAAGKLTIDMPSLGVQYLTLSSHKIGGPQGVGAVILSPTAPLKALIVGGGQELGRRSGTENVAGIAGFGVAAFEALVGLSRGNAVTEIRNSLEKTLRSFSNEIIIAGHPDHRLPNTSCIAMPGVKGETQVMHFDLNGICISSGSACSSGKVKTSHVLSAMGYSDDVSECSIRVSLGYKSTLADVEAFTAAWKTLYDRAGKRA